MHSEIGVRHCRKTDDRKIGNVSATLNEINDKALETFPPESTKENLLGKNILQ